MLSNVFDQPLQFELRSSRILLTAGAALYLLGALCWLQVPMPGGCAAMLYTGLLAHFVYLHSLHIANRMPGSIERLGWDRQRGWWLQRVDGRRQRAVLCVPVFVSRRLVTARFRTGRLRYRSVVIVADRLDAEAFRRLRARLIQSSHEPET